jgi:hypothetical protein
MLLKKLGKLFDLCLSAGNEERKVQARESGTELPFIVGDKFPVLLEWMRRLIKRDGGITIITA